MDEMPFTDVDLEREVLGACLLDTTLVPLAEAAGVVPDAFTDRRASVWEAIVALAHRGEPTDSIAVQGELRARGRLDAVGGLGYLMELTDNLPTLAHLERHARELVRLHGARRLLRACTHAARAAETDRSPEAWRDETLSAVQAASAGGTKSTAVPLRDAVAQWWEDYDAPTAREERAARFGLPSLDLALGDGRGMEGGKLYVLGARPAMGKSALAGQASLATARGGGRVLFFSLEMPRSEVVLRFLSGLARVDSRVVARRELSAEQMTQITGVSDILHGLPIAIDDTSGLPWSEIRARTLVEHARAPLSLVIVDHLHHMGDDPAAPKGENEERKIARVTAGAKKLAKDLGIPVLLLVQLNRSLESRQDKRPKMADIRGSGAVEQDADVILFLHRERRGEGGEELRDGPTEIVVEKQRGGATPLLRALMIREETRFEDLPPTAPHSWSAALNDSDADREAS